MVSATAVPVALQVVPDEAEAVAIGHRLRDAARAVGTPVSIGVAVGRRDRSEHRSLFGVADAALLAAKAGATFVSPFVGRHDDNGFDGMDLIRDIRLIYDNYDFATEILVASVRHGIHVLEAAKIGADVMTAPPAVIMGLVKHVLTDKGIEGFMADWAKTGQSI